MRAPHPQAEALREGEAGEQLDLFAAGAAPRRVKLEELERPWTAYGNKFEPGMPSLRLLHRPPGQRKSKGAQPPPVD